MTGGRTFDMLFQNKHHPSLLPKLAAAPGAAATVDSCPWFRCHSWQLNLVLLPQLTEAPGTAAASVIWYYYHS